MIVILSKPSATARLFREYDIQVFRHEYNAPQRTDLFIRWGNTAPLTTTFSKTLNTAEAIRLASDKARARQVLRDAGIPVPQESETDFPLVARTRHHFAGSGFYYCRNEHDLEVAKMRGAAYFSQFYPKQNEYRVHVAGGKTLLVSIKEGNKDALIWNHKKSGFTFRHLHRSVWLEDERLKAMVRTAKQAVSTIGLDFGAVDMMADADRVGDFPPHVVSEINTSPALSPLAISKYVTYFRQIERENT